MTESIAERPRRAPTRPGAILREDVLPALGISVTAMAKHLHMTRQQLHRILAEKAGISPEMACGSASSAATARACGLRCKPPTISGTPSGSSAAASLRFRRCSRREA
jgi:addiction module HigA family antidote